MRIRIWKTNFWAPNWEKKVWIGRLFFSYNFFHMSLFLYAQFGVTEERRKRKLLNCRWMEKSQNFIPMKKPNLSVAPTSDIGRKIWLLKLERGQQEKERNMGMVNTEQQAFRGSSSVPAPDPAFHFDADPDSAFHFDAVRSGSSFPLWCGSGSATLGFRIRGEKIRFQDPG